MTKKSVKPPAKTGRPTSYNLQIATLICEAIAEGKSVRAICSAPDMPAERTVYNWLASSPEFVQQYAHAHEAQADTLAGEIIEIADDSAADYNEDEGVFNFVAVQRAKLRIDSRKWVAAKRAPKKYGEGAGAVAVASVTVNSTTDDMAIAQRIVFILEEQRRAMEAKK